MTKIASNLQINSARLWDTIHETAKFGATPKGGVRRLTLGPEDKQVRDWFRKACEAAGLDVHVDALGSMFGLRKGRDMSKPPVGLGSHLDTQPTGGKFDGVLGTLAALEVVRTLNDAGIETEAPICIVNWTNEEGSRFAPAMMASAAYVGDFTTDDILARKDADGVTVAEALDSIGYRGDDAGRRAANSASFVELHIEQGPLLEAEHKTIGVVDSGQGVLWYDGKITGFESHAGTTPMPLRRDALATLSEIVLAMERIARKHGPKAVGTIGEAVIANPSRNVIPGEIAFTVDCRSADAAIMDALDRDLRAAVAEIAARRKVEVKLDLVWRKPPTHFDPKLVDAVENAAKALGYCHRRITSGAGHDACNLNTRIPVGDGLRALQGRRQPQRARGRHAGRLHRRRQCVDAYRAGACRRRFLTSANHRRIQCAEFLSTPTNRWPSFSSGWQRPGDPEVRIHRDPDITPGAIPRACSAAPRSPSSITPRCRPRSRRKCTGLKHVVFLGTGARSYMNPEELAELGIEVHLIKGYGDTAVAECAIALMWAAARGIAEMDREMRAGNWLREDGMQLTGKTLGLIGFGGIAAEVARIARGSGMRVIAWNRTPKSIAGVDFVDAGKIAGRKRRGLAASVAERRDPRLSLARTHRGDEAGRDPRQHRARRDGR